VGSFLLLGYSGFWTIFFSVLSSVTDYKDFLEFVKDKHSKDFILCRSFAFVSV
jgi:hypothetical protein